MLKFLLTVVAGIIVGAAGVYFTLDWQEEKLEYSITEPAKFGDINYQNITLSNAGWNPAVNVKVYIDHPGISFENIQAGVSLKSMSDEKNGIPEIERVRRDESLVLSLAYSGEPLFGSEVKIASDRSIAKQLEAEAKTEMPLWGKVALWLLGGFFALGVLSAIMIPAYQDYKKRAQEVKDRLEESR